MSVKNIAKKLGISKSSASIWCRDIILSPKQIIALQEQMLRGNYRGCLKGAWVQHVRRVREIKKIQQQGFKKVGRLSARDVLLIGLALYWGEGMKKEGRARIVNSDPHIIKFILHWFQSIWGIPKERFTLNILINEAHKDRIKEVQDYWSKLVDIPHNQFTKATFIKAKNKKVYENFSKHYGTLTIAVQKGVNLRHLILGAISAISAQ